jgi:IS5 family transposase
MSLWLDGQRALFSLVASDLRGGGRPDARDCRPRRLCAVRCSSKDRQLSYEELAFHLEDSASFRAFARLPLAWSPKKSVLHKTISAIRSDTWEAVNRALLASAKQEKLERGATVRIDSTVSAALMHEPSDSALLWDAVRVMTRLLRRAGKFPGAPVTRWRDRRRKAKKRARAIDLYYILQPRQGHQASALSRVDRRHPQPRPRCTRSAAPSGSVTVEPTTSACPLPPAKRFL